MYRINTTICIECWLTHPIPYKIYFCTQIYNNTKLITRIQPKDNTCNTINIFLVHKPFYNNTVNMLLVHVTSKIYHGDALVYPCTFLMSVTREDNSEWRNNWNIFVNRSEFCFVTSHVTRATRLIMPQLL